MALLKKILKNSYQEVVVKWTGSGTDTLALNTLNATGQVIEGSTQAVDIQGLSVTSSGATTITRNAQVAFQISGNYDFQSSGSFGVVINENSTSGIDINMAALGTIILKLRKTQGYSAPTL